MLTYFASPRRSKRTKPSLRAYRVWSTPSPTFCPGRKRVPRCRTRMLPAVTNWPPKRFTPSICGLESRPLRELPTPFLCAMALDLDARDPDGGQDLPMPEPPPVVLAALELHDQDLALLALAHDLAGNLGLSQGSRAGGDPPRIHHQPYVLELDGLALGAAQALDLDHLAGGNPVLLPARRDHRFHRMPVLSSSRFDAACARTLMRPRPARFRQGKRGSRTASAAHVPWCCPSAAGDRSVPTAGSHVLRQALAQEETRAVNPRLDGGQADLEGFGNLRIGQPLDVVEDERRPVIPGKLAHRLPEDVPQLGLDGGLIGLSR